jgi:hypothetical protein
MYQWHNHYPASGLFFQDDFQGQLESFSLIRKAVMIQPELAFKNENPILPDMIRYRQWEAKTRQHGHRAVLKPLSQYVYPCIQCALVVINRQRPRRCFYVSVHTRMT